MRTGPHHHVVPTVEVISMPEPPLVALDVAHSAPLVLEVRLPHQRTVPEDPQAALPVHDVLRLHVSPGGRRLHGSVLRVRLPPVQEQRHRLAHRYTAGGIRAQLLCSCKDGIWWMLPCTVHCHCIRVAPLCLKNPSPRGSTAGKKKRRRKKKEFVPPAGVLSGESKLDEKGSDGVDLIRIKSLNLLWRKATAAHTVPSTEWRCCAWEYI